MTDATFVIRDEGPGFDVSILPDPTGPENLCKPSGRGSMLLRTFIDEVTYNQVLLRKRKTIISLGRLIATFGDGPGKESTCLSGSSPQFIPRCVASDAQVMAEFLPERRLQTGAARHR